MALLKLTPCRNTQEGRNITRQNLNDYLEILHLAPTQFCDIPGFYRKTGFLRSHPLSLRNTKQLY